MNVWYPRPSRSERALRTTRARVPSHVFERLFKGRLLVHTRREGAFPQES